MLGEADRNESVTQAPEITVTHLDIGEISGISISKLISMNFDEGHIKNPVDVATSVSGITVGELDNVKKESIRVMKIASDEEEMSALSNYADLVKDLGGCDASLATNFGPAQTPLISSEACVEQMKGVGLSLGQGMIMVHSKMKLRTGEHVNIAD